MTGHTISEIASALSARYEGDGQLLVQRLSEPATADLSDLAVAMDAKYGAEIQKGRARAAVLWEGADWQSLGLVAAIFVDRPRLAMSALTGHFLDNKVTRTEIHPTSVIHPDAEIADGCSIGPFVVIARDVRIGAGAHICSHSSIGAGTNIGQNAILSAGVRIGERVTIADNFIAHSGVVIGADGFSFVTAQKSAVENVRENLGAVNEVPDDQKWHKIQSLGGVAIGDDVEIGANSSVDAGTIRATSIGDGTKIDALVQVGHNVIIGRNCLLCAHVAVGGSAQLGNGVVLGGQAGVADNIIIADGVVAGGASKILSNVPAGRAVLGYPAVKMDKHIGAYKALYRLPRLLKSLEKDKKAVSKDGDND